MSLNSEQDGNTLVFKVRYVSAVFYSSRQPPKFVTFHGWPELVAGRSQFWKKPLVPTLLQV